jgi:Flp pilus assembly pilin Flp
MRPRVLRLLFLIAIAVAMIGWLWMLFEGIKWAFD